MTARTNSSPVPRQAPTTKDRPHESWAGGDAVLHRLSSAVVDHLCNSASGTARGICDHVVSGGPPGRARPGASVTTSKRGGISHRVQWLVTADRAEEHAPELTSGGFVRLIFARVNSLSSWCVIRPPRRVRRPSRVMEQVTWRSRPRPRTRDGEFLIVHSQKEGWAHRLASLA